jgi:hypothetical protein
VALGLVVGFYLLSQAWSTLLAPPEGLEAESMAEETNTHPDAALGLTPHAELGRVRAEAVAAARAEVPIARYWMLTLVLVFMAIHIGRMDASLTWLGLLSPTVAVGGDLLVALVLGAGLVMPMRLCCRKLTRPIERAAWRYRLAADASRVSIADQLIHAWLDARLGFAVRLQLARGSLRAAAHMALTAGLPLTVVLVAMNPIWGFTWYFNQGCHRGQGRLRFRSRDHRRRANTVPGARGGTVATCVWHPNGWATRAVLRHTDR